MHGVLWFEFGNIGCDVVMREVVCEVVSDFEYLECDVVFVRSCVRW